MSFDSVFAVSTPKPFNSATMSYFLVCSYFRSAFQALRTLSYYGTTVHLEQSHNPSDFIAPSLPLLPLPVYSSFYTASRAILRAQDSRALPIPLRVEPVRVIAERGGTVALDGSFLQPSVPACPASLRMFPN